MPQSRTTALLGDYVRLYNVFEFDGQLVDPGSQPVVYIVSNNWEQESSSSSSSPSSNSGSTSSAMSHSSASSSESSNEAWSFGPFYAQKQNTGIWYVDWLVPKNIPTGNYYDVWKFQWSGSTVVQRKIFQINVSQADTFIQWSSPVIAEQIGDQGVGMMRELTNSLIWEAQHIPVYMEQGYFTNDPSTLNFAYPNWNGDPKPLLWKNNRILTDGWTSDMNGKVQLAAPRHVDDQFYLTYNFRYFSDEELLTFLNEGLYMMNATPPASLNYSNLESSAFVWRAPIVLYASIQALRRLVFGLEFQERGIIFGETLEEQQARIGNLKQLYQDYTTLWMEIRKDVKSKILPGIFVYVSPEYTLPGGRARWFRYLYK